MSVRSAARVLDLIEWLATRDTSVALSEACRALDLPKSSTLLLLKTLVDGGYATRGEDGRYRLIRLPGEGSAEAPAWGTIVRVAEPFVRQAVSEIEESGFVAVLTAAFRVRYLTKTLPEMREIRYDRDISADRIAHHVASGIVMLGAMPDAEVERYIAAVRGTPDDFDRPGDEAVLRERIARARTDGFLTNLDGRVEGAGGISAPILDAAGGPLAAVNIAGPRERIAANVRAIERVTRDTAERVSLELARRLRKTTNTGRIDP